MQAEPGVWVCSDLAAIQDHPSIAGVDGQTALGEMGQAAKHCDGGGIVGREDFGIKRDDVARPGIRECLSQAA